MYYMNNSTHQNGKGSKPRPFKKSEFNKNFDAINWGDKKKKTDKDKN